MEKSGRGDLEEEKAQRSKVEEAIAAADETEETMCWSEGLSITRTRADVKGDRERKQNRETRAISQTEDRKRRRV